MNKIIKTKDPRIAFNFEVERNPVIHLVIDGDTMPLIQTIGDTHLGRKFKTGVPVHRVGERENIVKREFVKRLTPASTTIKYIVIVGDLFDKFIVSPADIYFAYSTIREAAKHNPKVNYVILPGNHDLSKDRTKVSSFEIFNELCSLVNKDKILSDTNVYVSLNDDINHSIIVPKDGENFQIDLHFSSYSPFDLSTISRNNQKTVGSYPSIVFGHYDSMTYDGVGYLPCKGILDNADLIISGHEHSYKLHTYDGSKTPVLFTGSMQPYSHAEDPASDIYITVQDTDIAKMDLDLFKDKCLRIICDHTFALRGQIDCLALSFKVRDVITPDLKNSAVNAIVSENTEAEVVLSYSDILSKHMMKEHKDHPSLSKYLEALADKRFA